MVNTITGDSLLVLEIQVGVPAISRSNTWQIVFETAIEQNNEKHPKSVNEFRRGDESGH